MPRQSSFCYDSAMENNPVRWTFNLSLFSLMALLTLPACGGGSSGSVVPATGPKAEQIRLKWYRRLEWPTENCPVEPVYEGDPGINYFPLDEGQALVQVVCYLGAYQGNSFIYWLNHDRVRLLRFRRCINDDEAAENCILQPVTEITNLVKVDAQHREIILLYKYRGIGDCGQWLRYRFNDGKTSLLEMRIRNCPEEELPGEWLPPEHWPSIPLPAP